MMEKISYQFENTDTPVLNSGALLRRQYKDKKGMESETINLSVE